MNSLNFKITVTNTFLHRLLFSLIVVALFCLCPSPGRSFEVINSSIQSNKPTFSSTNWTLTTLPVGHGDAHVIVSPDGQISIVDTGSTETVKIIVDYLKKHNVNTIDRIIATHPHWDHAGGVSTLIDTFHVKKIIRPELDHQTDLVNRTNQLIKERGIREVIRNRGDTFSIGQDVRATVIHPGPKRFCGLNPNSLAFYFTVGQTRVLMMADVIGNAVTDLLDEGLIPEADIVKLAHHGNARGTTNRFLETVRPELAIIPAPLRSNDPWGRPDPELVDRLNVHGIPFFQTGKTGRIRIEFNKQFIESVNLGPSTRPAAHGLEARP
jgi:competence protein ComEC